MRPCGCTPETSLGDLQYPIGKVPAQVTTTIEASGDPGNWPFDSYKPYDRGQCSPGPARPAKRCPPVSKSPGAKSWMQSVTPTHYLI